ncbi:hypothetical protein HYN48_07185 [Flavobacterium magnum]|uniref:Uncharacterized protein n=1 Tax=Flavobacterium magnum TaxID=2162713 RepID=A0A2S0RDX7_9FLAO|nr:hypothetical protein [Flavobacterium magnum]AWA29876.1 hypothetical protein HYN48_07185 [Flavobacterium magnum]
MRQHYFWLVINTGHTMHNDEIPTMGDNKDKMGYVRKIGFYALIATLIVYYVLALEVIFM